MKTHLVSRQNTSLSRNAGSLLCCAAAVLLSACGGGSGDSSSGSSAPLINGSSIGEPAANVATGDLQSSAANSAAKSLNVNIGSVRGLGSDSSAIAAILNSPSLASILNQGDDNQQNDAPVSTSDVIDDQTDDNITSLVNATLGVDSITAQVSRDGSSNVVTIDPDESEICSEELLGMDSSQSEIENCQALLADLTVEIDAQTDDSGLMSYRFQGQDFLLIGYSPSQVNYELRLAGLHTLLLRAEELEGDTGTVPETMQGAVRLSAETSNDTPNAEAGSFSLSVTEDLRIIDSSDGTDISLAASELLSVVADAAAGTATISVGVGALQFAFADDDESGLSSITTLAMAGLTARADITGDGDVLRVSNFGIGNGPLTLSIDSVESLRVTLATFGFTVDGSTFAVDSALDLDVNLSNAMGLIDDEDPGFSVDFGLDAPGGTVLEERQNGSLQVSAGGPLTASNTVNNGVDNPSGSISVNLGECFSNDQDDSGQPFMIVDCGI